MNLYTSTNEALTEIYDSYYPQYDNLYTVEISSPSTEKISIEGFNLENYIKFHATKISFNGESLSLERDPITKRFKLKNTDSYSRTNTLDITWRECDGWKVKRYHDSWVGLIYNRKGCSNRGYSSAYTPQTTGCTRHTKTFCHQFF